MTDDRRDTSAKPTTRKVPPLAWIILAIVVLIIVVAAIQRQGTHTTASGGTMPQTNEPEGGAPMNPDDRAR